MTAVDPTYVNDALYAQLAEEAERARQVVAPGDESLRTRAQTLLNLEARLLDGGHLDAWLDLLTADCIYWVPLNPDGGDPRTEIAVIFDDRRRLEDRVTRLSLPSAHSQRPPSRTRRLISNVDAWREGDVVRVQSSFVLYEQRRGITSQYAGRLDHVVASGDDAWRIHRKTVSLLDPDHGLGNITFLF